MTEEVYSLGSQPVLRLMALYGVEILNVGQYVYVKMPNGRRYHPPAQPRTLESWIAYCQAHEKPLL